MRVVKGHYLSQSYKRSISLVFLLIFAGNKGVVELFISIIKNAKNTS